MSIYLRQNEDYFQTLLRAKTWHQKNMKHVFAIRTAVGVALALSAPLVGLQSHRWANGIALGAGIWLIVGRTILNRIEQVQQVKMVRFQEKFDTELFELPWNNALSGPQPAPEDAVASAARQPVSPALTNWYPDTSKAPAPLDILLCQRSSLVWGRRTHAQYSIALAGAAFAWILLLTILALERQMLLESFIVALFVPSTPALLDALDMADLHRRRSTEKQRLERFAGLTWQEWTGGTQVTKFDLRLLQDKIFSLRMESPIIPEWFYKMTRAREEMAMQEGTATLLDQAGLS